MQHWNLVAYVSSRVFCYTREILNSLAGMNEESRTNEMKLLILDLDETLVFAAEHKLDRDEDFRAEHYFVYKRPGVDEFIEFALKHFKVAVWTASSPNYADEVLNRLFPTSERLEFVWARQRCTWRLDPESHTGYWVKDLKKVSRLGHYLKNIVVVDDSPRKLERNYGNHIRISAFEGNPTDRELEKLAAYLLRLKDIENVRSVDKRSWRSPPYYQRRSHS